MPDVSADRRTFTVRLRDGPVFADGTPVEPRDVVASIERLVAADRGVAPFLSVIDGAAAFRSGRAARIAGLRAMPRAVRLRLARPAPDLVWILAHPQAAIVPAVTRAAGRVGAGSIAGAGPYRIRTHQPERLITLERNPAWGEDPVRDAAVDAIEARIASGPAAAVARINDGRGDLLLDPGPPDLGQPALGVRARSLRVATGCVRSLFLNTRVPPFNEGAARRAVAAAIDRTRLPGAGEMLVPTISLLPPTVIGHRTGPGARDPAAARVALTRAGRPDGFATQLVVGDTPRDRAEGAAIRRSLASVGIRVSVRTVAPAVLHARFYADPSARVPMGIATWCADWPGLAGRNVLGTIADPRARRDRAPNTVYANLAARALAEVIASASRVPPERADDAWGMADALVVATGALIPLVAVLDRVEVSPRLRGLVGAPMFPRGDPAALWLDPAAPQGG
jgi:peptide/nickel transport system substrate-binding protein